MFGSGITNVFGKLYQHQPSASVGYYLSDLIVLTTEPHPKVGHIFLCLLSLFL